MKPKREFRTPVRRRGPAGHIDTTYARELLALSGHSDGDEQGRAFLDSPCDDELSEGLGEVFLESATSGEGADFERLERTAAFEAWGPFVLTRGSREFGRSTDDSNPRGSTREPFPRVVGGDDAP